jgi:putative DNA primase/helicase
VIEELPEGHSLNVKRLKDTVGTPRITARKMRQDDVTFRATHCLMVNTNYLPIVVETDHGTWRRLALVRFPLKFVETKGEIVGARDRLGDPTLIAYFEETADPGVLRWIVEGAVAWYANGKRFPKRPKKIVRDTRAWRMDADPILAYVDERLTRDEGYAITTADLAADFNGWLERRGHKPWSQQTVNSRFQGHVSMDGIIRKQGGFGLKVRASRPRNLFGVPRAIPRVTMSWRGVRFADEEAVLSEAELDAATLSDLERRAQA